MKNDLKNNNKFTSKSDVLKFLIKKVKNSKIEKFLDFTVKQWEETQSSVITNIQTTFKNQYIVARSSAKGEDSIEKSQAGLYDSVLNIDSSDKVKIIDSINIVVSSYKIHQQNNPENKILIQKQSENIKISGVLFTRSENNGAPYYIINYDVSSSTDGVTSGRINNVLKIFRGIKSSKIPNQFKHLIVAIKEIEDIFDSTFLDIEFGITQSDQIIIFQVRPLTTIKHTNIPDNEISKAIDQNKSDFCKKIKSRYLFGKEPIFSDMADWNPAEIIGNNPNLLDYSLYDYLIMNKMWHKGRLDMSYHNVSHSPLMTKFGNKPYVDVRASFNSLLPDNIKEDIKKKLIEFYLIKLKNNPHLHDKVEFLILFTCYDFETRSRLKEIKNDFSQDELKLIESCLVDFTNNIINNFPQTYDLSIKCLSKLNFRRLEIFSNLNLTSKKYNELLNAAEELLNDCKELGARTFSTMARIAFIANALLKSIKSQNKLPSNVIDSFMNSIRTPLSELCEDFSNYCDGKINKDYLKDKYGHLRPGTYDILSKRYDDENSYFDNIEYLKSTLNHKFNSLEKIVDPFKTSKLNFDSIKFFEFARKAITQREQLKFEFTKNLSDALELIAQAGNDLGFSREDLSNLDINLILKSYKNKSKDELIILLHNKIKIQKRKKKIFEYLIHPSLIKSEMDFEIIEYFLAEPNFVTSKSVSSNIIILDNHLQNADQLDNKIVLIENADPGFDWIFTKNPSGLITKYGGVASHMSIRCAEVGLPAAIGSGDILFEKLLKAKKVLLDCKNEQIIVLDNKIFDEEMEVKKTLKSIGYIK
jgi:glutamine kinase